MMRPLVKGRPMFTVAREMLREDGKKVTMRVTSTEENVEVTYSLAGSQDVETKNYTPIEADMLLDLLSIQNSHAGELNVLVHN